MRHYSIPEYARFRWFEAAIALSAAASATYLWHEPPPRPYGGTWLGYTLGSAAIPSTACSCICDVACPTARAVQV